MLQRKDPKQAPMMQETIEEEEDLYEPFYGLEKLLDFGIQKGDLKKLEDWGVRTVGGILMTTKRKMSNVKGLSDAKIEKIYEAACKADKQRVAFHTAGQLLETRKDTVMHITTGSEELDNILGGGVETSSITEIHGEWRTGKTQLCITLAVASVIPEAQKGGDGRVLVFDTENTFRPERIVQVAQRFNYPVQNALDAIVIARVYTAEQFEERLVDATALLVQDPPFRLVIIDSIMMPFRFDYSGRGELSERQQRLGQVLSRFKKLAEEFNIAIVTTNQVCADPGSVFSNDAKKPVGGHVLAHLVDTRISVRKGKDKNRIAKLVDSPMYAEQEATFMISEGGVVDSTD